MRIGSLDRRPGGIAGTGITGQIGATPIRILDGHAAYSNRSAGGDQFRLEGRIMPRLGDDLAELWFIFRH